MTNFSLAPGATLVVQDTRVNLLDSANAAGLAKATSVQLTGSNTVTASQAKSLAAVPNFSLATGATLVVTGTATELLYSANVAGVAKATSVQLTGSSNTVAVNQATTFAALRNFSLATGATLVVQGSASNLLNISYAAGLAKATSLQLTGSNTATLSQANSLAALRNFSLATGATLVVQGGLLGLLDSFYATGLAKATSVQLTGNITVTASQCPSKNILIPLNPL